VTSVTSVSPRAIRLVVVVVCVLGIAGMIVASIADNVGAAVTFGLITAAAVLCSIVATAVTAGSPGSSGSAPSSAASSGVSSASDDAQAAHVEALVQRLVERGTDEADLRQLVGEAVRLGRGLSRTTLSG
jgi:hypothetical protein